MAQPSNPFASFGAWPWMGQTQPFAPIFKMPWQSDWMGDWARAMQSLQQGDAPNPLPPAMPVLRFAPEKLRELQDEYMKEATALWNRSLQAPPELKDRRFKNEAWARNPVAAWTAALYLLNARTLMALADAAEGDAKSKARLRFATEQWIAAAAPSNFLAFNAEAQQKALQTQGQSLAQGLANMVRDIQQGHMSMTDESQFEVGRNVATTEGAVVFENELFQLLEYKPLTEKVHEKPLLIVPPCINKFYILDLQPDNSFVRYAVAQGNRTFVVSWRNADESLAQKTWDDYIEQAVITAIEQVRDITGAEQINALGFCVGGTLLTTALAVLTARHAKAKGRKSAFPVASVTLLTTLVDFGDTGVLDVFIDEPSVQFRELQMGKGGLLKGKELASTFSFLRPNDLVWNYVVGNYLKGETPPPFDLLYWNSDSTNLPGPFYAWYLRNTYLENNLVKPGKLTVCGEKIDLRKLHVPFYVYGSREDHIVPIGGAYASAQALPGERRFVMGASGHIAGVINPPQANKRNYWLREDGQLPADVDQWLEGATEHPGSWWPDWSAWLAAHAGKQVPAPASYGRKPIEPAPGRYVKVKA